MEGEFAREVVHAARVHEGEHVTTRTGLNAHLAVQWAHTCKHLENYYPTVSKFPLYFRVSLNLHIHVEIENEIIG